jgi:rare lipoprotein A
LVFLFGDCKKLRYNIKMHYYWIILICLFLFSGCQDDTPVKGFYPAKGLATWYIPHLTASGDKLHGNELTCAMRKREFGKYYLVCNLDNNKCVEVRHNDFGPSHALFRRGRIIDLSRYAFSKIANLKKGVTRVRIGEVYSGKTD